MPRLTSKPKYLLTLSVGGSIGSDNLEQLIDDLIYWEGRGFYCVITEYVYRPRKRRWAYCVITGSFELDILRKGFSKTDLLLLSNGTSQSKGYESSGGHKVLWSVG